MFVSPFYCLQSKNSSSSAHRVVPRIRCGHMSALGSYWRRLPIRCGRLHQCSGIIRGSGKHL